MRLFISIISCQHHYSLRETARKTWLSQIDNYKFFIGGKSNENDVIGLECDDGKESVPLKQYKIFEHVLAYDFDFLFQCDDDTYVVYERLIECKPKKYQGFGKNYAKAGAGYFLSRKFVEELVQLGQECSEEYIGSKAELEFNEFLNYNEKGKFIVPTLLNEYITAHHVSPDTMKLIYKGLNDYSFGISHGYAFEGYRIYEVRGEWFGDKGDRVVGPCKSAYQVEEDVKKIEEFVNHAYD